MTDGVVTSVLLRARTAMEAQIVLALLRGEGITAFVNGAALMDEFSVTQRTMGLQGVVIEVRNEDLERARQLVDEARRTGQQAGDDVVEAEPATPGDTETEPIAALSAGLAAAVPPSTRGRRVALALGVLGWLLACFFFYGWVNCSQDLARINTARKNWPWTTVMQRDGWRTEWKDTGRVSSEYVDANHDGVAETTTHYVRAGWKRAVAFDANGNNEPERGDDFAANGRLAGTWNDADENGVSELKTTVRADGSRSIWHDENQDGLNERFEVHAADGRLTCEGWDRDEDGHWEIQIVHGEDGTTCTLRDLDLDGMYDRLELEDATGALVRVQVYRGLQGYVDEKP